MQKTKQPARLPHPPMTGKGKGFCIVASLLILTATSLRAIEPVMAPVPAPAMNQPALEIDIFPAAPADLWSGAEFLFADFSVSKGQPAAPDPKTEPVEKAAADDRLEKMKNPAEHDALLLVRENLTASSRPTVLFDVQAGYGRIWDEKSMLQKISSDHQEVGCAYVAANLSF